MREPQQFDVFQAIRLLELAAEGSANAGGGQPIGADAHPQGEAVRLRVAASLSFPGSAVRALRDPRSAPRRGAAEAGPIELLVNHFGLSGPSGVLPLHYTELLIRRIRQKDDTLRTFLDLFNHRAIALHYRAWKKYQLPVHFQQWSTTPQTANVVGQVLTSLVGLGTPALRNRQQLPDEVLLRNAGHFSNRHRTPRALEQLLSDFLRLTVRVLSFQGQWLELDPANQSQLPTAVSSSTSQDDEFHNRLGLGMVLGRRIWDVHGKFRLRIGPLSYDDFREFMPTGKRLRSVCELTRSYCGLEFDFDVQLVLRASEVPATRLGARGREASCLGWNSWIGRHQPSRNRDDAAFGSMT